MRHCARQGALRPIASSLAVAGAVLLAGLAGNPDAAAQQHTAPAGTADLSAAGLPTYQVGQTFIYSDGRTQHVVAAEDDGRVLWEDEDGTRSLELTNFVVPPLHVELRETTIDSKIYGSPEALWPLKPGNVANFSVEQTFSGDINRADRDRTIIWRCEVVGMEAITVAAGSFDTFRIKCDHVGRNPRAVKRERVYHYAPDLGHVVRITTVNHKRATARTVDLVAALTPEEATKSRVQAILKGLRSPG